MTGILKSLPNLGLGFAAFKRSHISSAKAVFPPSMPPEMRIMSGLALRIASSLMKPARSSSVVITSRMMAPPPRAAFLALSAVTFFMTPKTITCSPPPALDVERYFLVSAGAVFHGLPSRTRSRPVFFPSSSRAERTPTVTSSWGSSTVVGFSPLPRSRCSPSRSPIRIALVVVLPTSVIRYDSFTRLPPCLGDLVCDRCEGPGAGGSFALYLGDSSNPGGWRGPCRKIGRHTQNPAKVC